MHYAKEIVKNAEETHFQAEFLFKCSNQWQVLRDIKTIPLPHSYETTFDSKERQSSLH